MKNFDVEYDEGTEVDSQFGNGNLRASQKPIFKKTKYHTLVGGNNFYRIMPEMFGGIERESKHYTRDEAEECMRNGAWREVAAPVSTRDDDGTTYEDFYTETESKETP